MPVDPNRYSVIAGAFPTGVTVITMVDALGVPEGLTAQSIIELSVEPPLVLVSIDKGSRAASALQRSRRFVMNLLKSGSEGAAARFVSAEHDKFRGMRWETSQVADGAPILRDDSVAYAECVITKSIEAGDHLILIASVEGGEVLGGIPLVYYRGRYAPWRKGEPVPPSRGHSQ